MRNQNLKSHNANPILVCAELGRIVLKQAQHKTHIIGTAINRRTMVFSHPFICANCFVAHTNLESCCIARIDHISSLDLIWYSSDTGSEASIQIHTKQNSFLLHAHIVETKIITHIKFNVTNTYSKCISLHFSPSPLPSPSFYSLSLTPRYPQ